ncbi:hypothetical protein [Altererythrobacter sp.]|uniref:hypothetical protein n=1 Tax=Altererythrobacter sp. TaxID=1872480 RepID=UPI003D01600A
MRSSYLAVAAALAAASPVSLAAQEVVPDSDSRVADLSDRLSDPEEQERIAGMVDAMGEIFLAMPVGPMMEALSEATGEDGPDVDRNATVRDLAGPGADRLPAEIADKVPHMMGMMAAMARSMDAMRPMLEAMGQSLREEIRSEGRF